MKHYILLVVFLASSFFVFAQEKATTYYLIRHAEKDRTNKTNKNPNLTKKGLLRAKKWSEVFKNVPFDIIYSTNYNRTRQTATPTAKKNNLKLTIYNPSNLFSKEFQENTKGKTVLIVGHSDTTPLFTNKILGENKYSEIKDNNNANLYIVTLVSNKRSSNLLKID